MLTESDVRAIADRVLTVILGSSGFVRSEVEARRDHTDEDSLFVTAHFAHGSDIASGTAFVEAISALRHALEAEGERRFPYLSADYPDEEAPFERDEVAIGA